MKFAHFLFSALVLVVAAARSAFSASGSIWLDCHYKEFVVQANRPVEIGDESHEIFNLDIGRRVLQSYREGTLRAVPGRIKITDQEVSAEDDIRGPNGTMTSSLSINRNSLKYLAFDAVVHSDGRMVITHTYGGSCVLIPPQPLASRKF